MSAKKKNEHSEAEQKPENELPEAEAPEQEAAAQPEAPEQEAPPAPAPEKPKPAATAPVKTVQVAPAAAKNKPEKPERPSMIVKPVIMTVETNADGKSTITHNALRKDKQQDTQGATAPSAPQNVPAPQRTAVIADGKNKYRNAPNNKPFVNREPAADTRQAGKPAAGFFAFERCRKD